MALIVLTTTVALCVALGLGAAHLMLWAVVLFLKRESTANTLIAVPIHKEAEYETQTTYWHTPQMDPLSTRTAGYVSA
jgi:hypothetical protein